jgi:hypothetical protein
LLFHERGHGQRPLVQRFVLGSCPLVGCCIAKESGDQVLNEISVGQVGAAECAVHNLARSMDAVRDDRERWVALPQYEVLQMREEVKDRAGGSERPSQPPFGHVYAPP